MLKTFKKIKYFFHSYSWAPYLLFFVLIFAIYGRTISYDYSYLDDQQLILQHADILDRANAEEIFFNDVFFSPTNSFYYRPILTWSFVLDWHLGGANIHFFHFSNLIYHFIAVCLLFYLLMLSKINKEKAFFLALLFALHPVVSQAVAWVPGRNDSLVAIFIFSAIIFFSRFLQFEKIRDLIFLGITFLLALLTKESAVLVAPFALFWAFIFRREYFGKTKIFIAAAVAITSGLLWYLIRSLVILPQSLGSTFSSLWDNITSPLVFFSKIFYPFNLSVYSVIADVNFIYGIIALFILLSLLIISRPRTIWPSVFGFLWFWLFLMFSSVRPDGIEAQNFMEHRIYVGMFGVLIILAQIQISKKFIKSNKIIYIISSLIIIFLAVLSFSYSRHFKNKISFWEQAAISSPHSALVQRNLGAMYYLDQRFFEAELYAKKALEINPNEPMANNNIAVIYMEREKYQEAERFLKRELELNPNYDLALLNLGQIYYLEGDYSNAKVLWQKILSINPYNQQASFYLKKLYEKEKE